jgi:hypothetical protein
MVDGEYRKLIGASATGIQQPFWASAATDGFEHRRRQRIFGAGVAHRVGGYDGDLETLAEREQPAIDELVDGATMKGELEVQPIAEDAEQLPREAQRFGRLTWIAGPLDGGGE